MPKYDILTGKKKSNKFIIPRTHIGTTDFFKPTVLAIQEMVPGDHFKVNLSSFLRGKPLALPTMGKINHNVHAFFVPMRTIHSHWNEFITETPYQRYVNTGTSVVFISPQTKVWQKVPSFTNADLIRFFLTGTFSYSVRASSSGPWSYPSTNAPFFSGLFNLVPDSNSTNSRVIQSYLNSNGGITNGVADNTNSGSFIINSSDPSFYLGPTLPPNNFDFVLELVDSSSSNNTKYFGATLSKLGRLALQIFESLGYSFSRRVRFRTSSSGSFVLDDSYQTFSFLPLLSFCKVITDYFIPSQFYVDYASRLEYFSQLDNPLSFLPDAAPFPFRSLLGFVSYDSDYFTSAWTNPTGPSSQVDGQSFDIRTLENISDYSDTASFDSQNGVYLNNNSSKLTTQSLNMLYSLQSWAIRNNVAGYRAIDRMFAQFGVNLNSIQSNRSVYLKGSRNPFVVSDVTNTSAIDDGSGTITDTQVLGGYAGKIATSSEMSVDYKTDEFGYMIIMQTIIPEIGYVQGAPKDVQRVDALDFFQASFDNKGVEAIGAGELVLSDAVNTSTTLSPNTIFGFTPRYSSYKLNTYDRLTGDFVLRSKNTGLEAFDLFRRIPWNIGRISLDFLKGEQKQYDRIFNYVNDDYDHFYFYGSINIVAYRNMNSLSDSLLVYDMDHSSSGQVAHMNSGGQFIN